MFDFVMGTSKADCDTVDVKVAVECTGTFYYASDP